MALYATSLVVGTVILLIFAVLLAYLIYPLVLFLQHCLPRALAIAIAYLLVAGVLAAGIFIVTSSLIRQASALAQSIQFLFNHQGSCQSNKYRSFNKISKVYSAAYEVSQTVQKQS